MKFLAPFAFLASLAAVSAQSVNIASPIAGTSVRPGHSLNVEIDRPNSLEGSIEVAIVIGFESCPTYPCYPAAGGMGTVLYNGPYNPQYQASAPHLPPHQNFTVTIPSTAAKGTAHLNVAHVALTGVSDQY
ncbi:hypothetical protein H0H81_011839 [Sphagnurus paluster]|uniref:Uncharacterized protein n=1 Tax=Sphagnurus paluster TaxID=117069 RepID=A0A9P7K290_9AGAR|nr:hypothetical protein H0H81_011839 [Sphagnurus paluster]